MANAKTGVWLIGAFGGVATTAAVGIAAVRKGLAATTALATFAPPFDDLPFPSLDSIVVGGHDVRQSSFGASAGELLEQSRVFTPALLTGIQPDLDAWSTNVRPGVVSRSGKPVEDFADWTSASAATGADLIQRIAQDLQQFKSQHHLDQVIVVNVSSSEPMPKLGPELDDAKLLDDALRTSTTPVLPASSLYGLAACQVGASFINFTPSLGLDHPELRRRADHAGICYMGKDGKTGETLMKAVLAPMFLKRNWKVLSWVGHNILGNRDGLVLQDPVNKQGKIESKGHLIGQILGYEPQSLVTIEHIASMADWKTAWDHIHFEGFLGAKMSLQFIWQGCDSLLAGPLVIDLIRWTQLAQQRGERGCLKHLAGYFKSPMGVEEQDFFRQWAALESYAQSVKQ